MNKMQLDLEEVMLIFAATGAYYQEVEEFSNSDKFFSILPIWQERTLNSLEQQKRLYRKLRDFLNNNGVVGANTVFDEDTRTKPKGDYE